MRRAVVAVLAGAMVVSATGTTSAVDPPAARRGYLTPHDAMLTPVMAGVEITPLLTVGDTLPDGYRFESIPDGISLKATRRGVHVWINHETSKVPFPYNPTLTETDPAESQNDFDNAQISHLVLNPETAGTLRGSFAIDSAWGFQRFCSNFLATQAEGFARAILFTNEESPDYVFRREDSWPPPIGSPRAEEAGLVVALDTETGNVHEIYGMGRHNHENSVAIPGFEDLVVLSGDDTFTSGPLTEVEFPEGVSAPAQSQLYSYVASGTNRLLHDRGNLYAFVSDTPGIENYYDVPPNSNAIVTGRFIPVPRRIATGLNRDGSEVTSEDFGYPPPPSNGSWQTDLRSSTPVGIDGPQWVLEYWSDINNVFQFVRVEDIAYDKRPGIENVVYIVDSGRGRRADQSLDTNFRSTNGRVWQMVLHPEDPLRVISMRVFVEGDDNPVKTPTEVHQPDNIESARTGILLTEDPGSSQQYTADDTSGNATTARLWYVPFTGSPQVVAKVDQSADEGPMDVDPADNPPFAGGAFPISPGNLGAWESSGIVDASDAFGPGAFLIDVQAHTLWIDSAPGEDNDGDGIPDFTYKREGGQLLLIRIPGVR